MSKLINAEYAKLNVFELDESKTYYYQLISLAPGGHGGMGLRIFDRWGGFKDSFGIDFSYVDYVLGPTQWKGGIFRSASQDECYHLRKSLGFHIPNKDPLSASGWELADYALFELATSSGNFVRILASTGVTVNDNWEDFVRNQELQLLERVRFTDDGLPVIHYKDGGGVEKDLSVEGMLRGLANDYPLKAGYSIKSEDIQAALLFASNLVKKTYGENS